MEHQLRSSGSVHLTFLWTLSNTVHGVRLQSRYTPNNRNADATKVRTPSRRYAALPPGASLWCRFAGHQGAQKFCPERKARRADWRSFPAANLRQRRPGRAAVSRQTGEGSLDRERNDVLPGTATQPDFLLPALALGAHRPGGWAHSSERGRSRDKPVVTHRDSCEKWRVDRWPRFASSLFGR